MLKLKIEKPHRLWVRILRTSLVSLLLVAGAYAFTMLNLPAPKPVISQKILSGLVNTGAPIEINWPASQQAAIGASGYGVVAIHGKEQPLPTASVAKVIAALAILQQKPLELNQPGPTITLTGSDVALYNLYRGKGGSVVRVAAGEKITQYQALQAMLIPSANNMAASLTNWAFGSEAAYTAYANTMVANMGLKNTRVADASGFSPNTLSTAKDLVVLGIEAMKHPVIAQIVAQTEATLPVAGKVFTTNDAMGKAGINGIKTGHTEQSGGCFLFTATREVAGKQITVVGAVMGAPTIEAARASAPGLIEVGYSGFASVEALAAGAAIAEVIVPWAQPATIKSKDALSQVVWKGTRLNLGISTLVTASEAGTATFGDVSTQLVMPEIPKPDTWWRLSHPLELLNAR